MKYLKRFNESAIEDYLGGNSFQEFDPGDTWNLLADLSKYPGPSPLTESDYPKIERLLLKYFKPELTGAELKYRSIYSLGRLDPKDIMCQVNWKLEYPNEMRFDVTVTKYEDDYFFVKSDGVPVSDTTRKPWTVRHPMSSDDIFLESNNWFIDGWDGFNDWIMSSPINESNNYDLLKCELKDYHESRRVMLLGIKTNEYRTLMTSYRKIGNDVSWHFFDDKGYHFGTAFLTGGCYFKHDGSVDQFCRRKS